MALGVVASGGGLREVVAGLLVLASAALAVLALLTRPWLGAPRSLRVRPRFALAMTRRSLPLAPTALAEFTSLKIDNVLPLAILGGSAAGVYSVAAQLYLALVMAPLVLTKAFLPRFTRLQDGDIEAARAFLGRYVRLFLGISTLTALLALTVGRPVVLGVFGDEFRAAAGVLAALSPTLFLTALNRLYNHALIGLGENRWFFVVTGSGAGLNVLGNLALIPLWGVYGAAAMTVATEGLVLVGARKRVRARLEGGRRIGTSKTRAYDPPEADSAEEGA